MRVSIIVPTFNQAEYLSETLDSVLSQKYNDWECVIVNDGSTDLTESIIQKYCSLDKRFSYIRQKNSGPSVARNVGILNSEGEFILPLDSDDHISECYLTDAINIFIKKPKIKLVYSYARMFGGSYDLWIPPDYSYDQILIENMLCCTAMFRRSDFDETNGYNTNMKEGLEDWDFWLSFLKNGDVVYRIPKINFYYRVRDHSRHDKFSKNSISKKKMYKQIFLNHLDSFKNNGVFFDGDTGFRYKSKRFLYRRLYFFVKITFITARLDGYSAAFKKIFERFAKIFSY